MVGIDPHINIIEIVINSIIAIILGIAIDNTIDKIHRPSKPRTNTIRILRVVLQMLINVIILTFINKLYITLNVHSIYGSVYFIALFLGVQRSMFVDAVGYGSASVTPLTDKLGRNRR